MSDATGALQELSEQIRRLGGLWRDSPLELTKWLPHQAVVMRDDSRYRLLRTGNQLGKTRVGVAEVLCAAAGIHPYRAPTLEHGEYWICCASWSQSIAIQGKVHELVWADRLPPGTQFSDERGYGGRYPSVQVRHEDGHYSTIRFKTTGQETLDLAGATIDGALFDEPPKSQSTFAEIQKRVQANGGWILITLTPIGADVEWLRQLVVDGMISEHHARLTPPALIPVGHDRPLRMRDRSGRLQTWDANWVSEVIRMTPESEVDIRVHGQWDSRPIDAYFASVWREGIHVRTYQQIEIARAGAAVICHVGIDHGHKPGKQYACVLEVDDTDPDRPRVDLVAEYVDREGMADPVRDAEGILGALAEAGWEWHEAAFAGGDRDHMPGSAWRKSNVDIEYALVELLSVGSLQNLQPRIRTMKRGAGRNHGSVATGCRWLYQAIADGRFRVASHCERAIGALRRYRMKGTQDEHKDVIDAIRYGCHTLIFRSRDERPASAIQIG